MQHIRGIALYALYKFATNLLTIHTMIHMCTTVMYTVLEMKTLSISAQCPALTILFHGQERNLVTEPSLWPVQLYGTVYQQQFVKLTVIV